MLIENLVDNKDYLVKRLYDIIQNINDINDNFDVEKLIPNFYAQSELVDMKNMCYNIIKEIKGEK